MDHKTLLASMPNETRHALLKKSDARGLAHLTLHWGATVLLIVAVALKIPLWQLLELPLGILLISNFMLLHETVHQTPFNSNWLNRITGRVASVIVVLPQNWFGYFHLAHHKYTNDPDNDPELVIPKPENRLEYIFHISGLPTWLSQIKGLLRNAASHNQDRFVPAKASEKLILEARLMLVFYMLVIALILLGQSWLWRCWLLPVILGQPFLRLYLMAEHGRCPPVANMFENTRTTFTTSVARFLAWNMPYHCEHHAYPSVPFHRLPDLHALTKEHLVTISDGYTAFHIEYLDNL